MSASCVRLILLAESKLIPAQAARAPASVATANRTAPRLLLFMHRFLPIRVENTPLFCPCKQNSPTALFGAVTCAIKLTFSPIPPHNMQSDQTTVTLSRPGSKPHEQIDIVIPA